MIFNKELYLWRTDIEDSVLLYKIGGEQFFMFKGNLKNIFLELLAETCILENGKLKDFLLKNKIFKGD